MRLSGWLRGIKRVILAGPVLIMRLCEMAVNSLFVIAERSRRLVDPTRAATPRSRKREIAAMGREKIAGFVESTLAIVAYSANALLRGTRRSSSLFNYIRRALVDVADSDSIVEAGVRLVLIIAKLLLLAIKQPQRWIMFLIDVARQASTPLHRRVIANTERLQRGA